MPETPANQDPANHADGWRRLRAALRPRATRARLAVAALCALLGFGLVVQVRNSRDEVGLRALRPADLVRLLDDQSERSERLRQEIADLEAVRNRLRTSTDRSREAVQEARNRAEVLGILAGTLPATGPGIELTIADPNRHVEAAHLLDAVQELRAAGAEVMQVGGQLGGRPGAQPGTQAAEVRVVVHTYLLDGAGGVLVDGTPLLPPYRFLVVGDPATLAAALEIPGGILDTLRGVGAEGRVRRLDRVTVSALRPLHRPQYARPASPAGTGG